jgi:hypothetical protein
LDAGHAMTYSDFIFRFFHTGLRAMQTPGPFLYSSYTGLLLVFDKICSLKKRRINILDFPCLILSSYCDRAKAVLGEVIYELLEASGLRVTHIGQIEQFDVDSLPSGITFCGHCQCLIANKGGAIPISV